MTIGRSPLRQRERPLLQIPAHFTSWFSCPKVRGSLFLGRKAEIGQLRKAETVDEARPLTATMPETSAASLSQLAADLSASSTSTEVALTVCVVCCSTASMPHDALLTVAKAMVSVAAVRTIFLSETGSERTGGVDVIAVPCGTKLSKIRRLADLVTADLFCICDPDLTIDETACRIVLRQAMVDVRAGKEVIAFGIVEGRDDGTLLSRVVAVDKWLSHRILRRFLWAAGIGITLPGQFLLVTPGVLRSLDPVVDSYLDDLYLGWIARERGVCVHRVPVVVGKEDSRTSWLSLLTQRCRWMLGLVCLFRHLVSHPTALGLLGIHFLAYHATPIIVMILLLALTFVNPLAGFCVFVGLAAMLSIVSGQSLLASVVFISLFPFVHVLATLLWWVPVKRSVLMRR